MNAQEVFDTVVNHLRTQKQPAINSGDQCRYRHTEPDGTVLRCAVGCLIADDEYLQEMEGTNIDGLLADYLRLPNGFLREKLRTHYSLLRALQSTHDDVSRLGEWEACFEEIANYFNLKYTPPVSA